MRRIEKQQDMEPDRDAREKAVPERPMVVVAELTTYAETVPRVLDALGAAAILASQNRIVLKPNLIQADPPPVTTDAKCVEAVIKYCKRVSQARIIVTDGSGGSETEECFVSLGYRRLERDGVELVDLNKAETVTLTDSSNSFLSVFHMPAILQDSYVISIPVLKAHSMASVTLGMKNMMGMAPEKYYSVGGHYKKWGLHKNLNQAILELNKFRKPDLTIIDAAVGMATAHLWGPKCDPPVNKMVASFDPVAADRVGCELLGKSWQRVEHIFLADGVLGHAEAEVKHVE